MFSGFDPLTALIIFVSYTAIDALYAVYTVSIVNKSKLKASNVGAFMYILIGVGTINYVENWLYIIPMAAGGWAGTYLSLTLMERKEKKDGLSAGS